MVDSHGCNDCLRQIEQLLSLAVDNESVHGLITAGGSLKMSFTQDPQDRKNYWPLQIPVCIFKCFRGLKPGPLE